MILVVDKGAEVGSHTLSGAVVDPIVFRELFPQTTDEDLPFISPVHEDSVHFLTQGSSFKLPGALLPREMHNSSDYRIASISEMTRWLAAQCEEAGVEVYTEFSVDELIREDGRIVGARIADKGLNEEGEPGEAYAPGMDLMAKVTVLGEGTRGYLAEQLIADEGLDAEANPQVWGVGVKEIIEIPEGRIKKGTVHHTFGHPLDSSTYGGGFIYALEDNQIALGLVFGLDYPNPLMETHGAFLQFKKHPFIASLIEGGKVLEYGAKTLPEGGYHAIPRLAVDGAVLVGDSAGFLNTMRLKGIHLAMKSGMLAADKICDALANDDPDATTLDYRQEFESSWAGEEMRRTRNFRQGFHGGLVSGMFSTGLHMLTSGAMSKGRKTMPPDHESMKKLDGWKETPKVATDDSLYLDILTDVYKSGSIHREDQPSHCKIPNPDLCETCYRDYGAPCTRFCPAKVYEMEQDEQGNFAGIRIDFSNCVHCKTCEIKDPLENLKWRPPDGGDGPKYNRM